MWKLVIAASCLLAVCHAQFGMRGRGMAMSPVFRFGRGFAIDFSKFNSLEAICNQAMLTSGVTDHLSDVMRNAVQYKMDMGANLMTLGGTGANSNKWNCLLGAATTGYTNPGNAANGVGDYFDTATEMRIQPFLPFQYNPCEMVFCGEQGMTPAAMAREVMMRLQSGMPLGGLANVFGSHAAKLANRRGGTGGMMPGMGGGMSPMGGGMGGGMSSMGGMNPMSALMGGGGMSGMSGMPGMGNMQQMMKMMSSLSAGNSAIKTPSSNAVSTNTGTDPTANTPAGTNGTGNTVTNQSTPTNPSPAPSSGSSAMSNALSLGSGPGGMMANALKAMTGGMGGGMPGMGMPGMGMPGMGMPGMGMPGMGMPGMGMPGMMGMGMPGMGMTGMGMPGMGGMGGMGGMLGAMMMGEYLMDMPDPPPYGMRGGYGMGMGGPMGGPMGGAMGGPMGSPMPGMPPPPPPIPQPTVGTYGTPTMSRPAPPPLRHAPPPPPAPRTYMTASRVPPPPPSGLGGLTDIFNAMG